MNVASMISDGVLALASFAFVRPLVAGGRERSMAALGLGLIGAAALCGSVRFGGVEALRWAHQALSDAATAISMPTLGAAALGLVWPLRISARGWTGWLGALAGLFVAARLFEVMASYGLVIGALGTVGVLAAGVRGLGRWTGGARLLIAGGVLVLIAGLGVGNSGEIAGVARLDVFHYLLAASNLALGAGFLRVGARAGR